MSSAQVIDSEKAAQQLARHAAYASREKQDAMLADADAKRANAAEAKDGRFDTTDADAQLGRPLSQTEIQKKLLRLNPDLIFERSLRYPTHVGIYQRDPFANQTDPNPSCRGRRHIAGMMSGISPEFTIRRTVMGDGGVEFQSEVRGWRTVLARLIVAGVISLAAAEREFAIPQGRESEAWWKLMA